MKALSNGRNYFIKKEKILCQNYVKTTVAVPAKQKPRPKRKKSKRQIKIEFLYLDLDECDPCRDSETNVTDALEEIANVLRATGVEIILERIHVESLEQALALGFKTSPTILINGKRFAVEFRGIILPVVQRTERHGNQLPRLGFSRCKI